MSNIIVTTILIGYAILIIGILCGAVYTVVNYIVGHKTPKKKSRKHLRLVKK